MLLRGQDGDGPSGRHSAGRVKTGRRSAWQLASWGSSPPLCLSLRRLTTTGPFSGVISRSGGREAAHARGPICSVVRRPELALRDGENGPEIGGRGPQCRLPAALSSRAR